MSISTIRDKTMSYLASIEWTGNKIGLIVFVLGMLALLLGYDFGGIACLVGVLISPFSRGCLRAFFKGLFGTGRSRVNYDSHSTEERIISRKNIFGKICPNSACGYQNGWGDFRCKKCKRMLI